MASLTWLAILVCLLAFSGCAGNATSSLETKYGKTNEQPRSINSTSLFAARLEELGYEVSVRNRISPKIDEFDIVFWFPENVRCPSEGATEAIEKWMDEGYGSKTLVYVGADYRSDEDYYRAIQKRVAPELKAEAQRLLSEAQLASQNRKNTWTEDHWGGNTKCDWFDIEVLKPRKKSNLLTGPMATNANFYSPPKLPVEVVMSPKKSTAKWSIESLLAVDGENLVYRLTDNRTYSTNQIIVVQNASFLVNLAAADPDKRAIADQLVAEAISLSEDEDDFGFDFGFGPKILILESEYDIPIRSTDFVNQNSWAWISEEPLCYIVPHALLWGVLFCFVYFPIFGRPKRLPQQSTSTFRNHIKAIAKQLSRSGDSEHARRTIQQYQESILGSNKKNS